MGEEKICADIQTNFVPPVGFFVLLLFFPIFVSKFDPMTSVQHTFQRGEEKLFQVEQVRSEYFLVIF